MFPVQLSTIKQHILKALFIAFVVTLALSLYLVRDSIAGLAATKGYLPGAKNNAHAQRTAKHKPAKKISLRRTSAKKRPRLLALAGQSPSTLGQTHTFALYNSAGGKVRTINARLKASSGHTDIWVDTIQSVPQPAISQLLERFEKGIYPRDVSYFCVPSARARAGRINILITNLGAVDTGYFDSRSIDSPEHMNLIYLNSRIVQSEPQEACNTLAHELEHLLFYVSGGADVEWLDEGMAVYAEYLNGGRPSIYISDFQRNPKVKLPGTFTVANNSYGAAFSFVAFAANQVEKSGNSVPDFMQSLIKNAGGGVEGINSSLHRYISNPQLDSFSEIYHPRQLAAFAGKL